MFVSVADGIEPQFTGCSGGVALNDRFKFDDDWRFRLASPCAKGAYGSAEDVRGRQFRWLRLEGAL